MVKILALWTAIFLWWAFVFVKNKYNIKILAPTLFWSCSMTYSCPLYKYPWILSGSICLHSGTLLARDYSISRQSWEFIFYYLISRSLPLSHSGLFLEKMVGFIPDFFTVEHIPLYWKNKTLKAKERCSGICFWRKKKL